MLEGRDGRDLNKPIRLVMQFGGISREDAIARHEAEHGQIGDADIVVLRGVSPGRMTA